MKQALIGTSCIAKFEDAVGYELQHAQMYRHLASQMQGLGYFGAQKMFLAEIPEEQDHFQRHIDFLNDDGVTIPIPEIPAYKSKIKTLKDAITVAYETELDLLKFYREMAKEEAVECPEILQHLMQFLEIQRTTVGEYGDWLARIELAKDDACGLLFIDAEMGK